MVTYVRDTGDSSEAQHVRVIHL